MIPEIKQLKHRPQVSNLVVGDDVVDKLEEVKLVPTLLFVDPWGYKGLSLRLINSVLKNWGSDCIIFFNYDRINSGIHNPTVKEHMDALFGAVRAEKLRTRLRYLKSIDRERAILEEIAEAFREMDGKYFLSFRFSKEAQKRIGHHLLFVSKNFKGYDIMKDVMAKESSSTDQGVPSFEYNPRDYSLRFELSRRPLDDLEGQLLDNFAGCTRNLPEIYKEHSVGKPFVAKNYRQALANLEDKGAIQVYSAKPRPRKGTYAPHVRISFPARSE